MFLFYHLLLHYYVFVKILFCYFFLFFVSSSSTSLSSSFPSPPCFSFFHYFMTVISIMIIIFLCFFSFFYHFHLSASSFSSFVTYLFFVSMCCLNSISWPQHKLNNHCSGTYCIYSNQNKFVSSFLFLLIFSIRSSVVQ